MKQEFKKGRGQTEKLISVALLPQKKVKSVLISNEFPEIIETLNNKYNINTVTVNKNPELDAPISKHADCCLLQLNNNVFIEQNNYINIVNYLTSTAGEEKSNFHIIPESVFSPYPNDVPLNAKVIGDKIICKAKYLSEAVTKYALEFGFDIINVNQGYAACSSITVSENALITDDESIYVSSKSNGIDCILISKGFVNLNGYEYGFIGGTCGMIDKNLLAFTGRINNHTDAELIINFLSKHNVRYTELSSGPLVDIGGIIPLTELNEEL